MALRVVSAFQKKHLRGLASSIRVSEEAPAWPRSVKSGGEPYIWLQNLPISTPCMDGPTLAQDDPRMKAVGVPLRCTRCMPARRNRAVAPHQPKVTLSLPLCGPTAGSLDMGKTSAGERVDDVVLPAWAGGDPLRFLAGMRLALESPQVGSNLHKASVRLDPPVLA